MWLPSSRSALVVLTIIRAGEPLSIKQIVEAVDPETWKHVSYMEQQIRTMRTIGTADPTDGQRITFEKARRTVLRWLGPYAKYTPPVLGYQGVYMLLGALESDRVVYRAGRGDGEKAHRSANTFAVYTAEERKAALAQERREWRAALEPDDDTKAAALEHEKATGVKVRFEVQVGKYPQATRRLHLDSPGRAVHTYLLCRRDTWEDALMEVGVMDDPADVLA